MADRTFTLSVHPGAIASVNKAVGQHARRLGSLLRELAQTKSYRPEIIHQLRILTRKCVVGCKVLRQAGLGFDGRKTSRLLRKLRRTLGRVRDADIRLQAFQAFSESSKRNEALAAILHFDWNERRLAVLQRLRNMLPSYQETIKRLVQQSKSITQAAKSHRWKKQNDRWLAKQLAKRKKPGTKLVPEELHQYRIETKRLRYLLQILPLHKVSPEAKRWMESLKVQQHELGQYQDWTNLLHWLDKLEQSLTDRRDSHRALKTGVRQWRRHCQRSMNRLVASWRKSIP